MSSENCEVAFSDAYDEGQKMTLDEAVAYALQENPLLFPRSHPGCNANHAQEHSSY